MDDHRIPSVAPCLMVQGTASGVGKSVLVTALCRLFSRAGYRVAPFKAQNMALNSAVTVDGGEIGRAQAAQAEAAGVEATVDMNPILLKPEADDRSQVVVRGEAIATVSYREYRRMTPTLRPVVEASLGCLRRAHDLVVIEGAGSPAEINLREGEIVNMTVARFSQARVLLVGDIDRGGVFAALVGTMELLDATDRARVAGFIVNKFRGDRSLLDPGLDFLTARTGVPVLGVVPWVAGTLVPAEDSLDLDRARGSGGEAVLDVAVVRLPRIANFDDFDPLSEEPGIRVRFVRAPIDLEGTDLIVLPGTKSTIADLQWLRESGLGAAVVAAAARGRPVLGVCGGYQMLGLAIHDPDSVESPTPTTEGLGLLPVVTTFTRPKRTVRIAGRVTAASPLFAAAAGAGLTAYEIHAGRTLHQEPSAARRPPFAIVARRGEPCDDADGAQDAAGTVLGTYLHGLFANGDVRRALLNHLADRKGAPRDPRWGRSSNATARYDELADAVEAAVDMPAIAKLVGLDYVRSHSAPCSGHPRFESASRTPVQRKEA